MSKSQRYTKNPVEIEAIQWDGTVSGAKSIVEWAESYETELLFVGEESTDVEDQAVSGSNIIIPTLEGDMRAMPGDYIIKGVEDEFYPCRSDIFEKTYSKAKGDVTITSMHVTGVAGGWFPPYGGNAAVVQQIGRF